MTLRLLDEVSHDGRPVTGERSQALLAALAADPGRAVAESVLVEAVWGPDARPANPAKALQVVVSRTRAQAGAAVVVRVDHGYRLGVAGNDLDVSGLADLVRSAERAEAAGALDEARDRSRAALAVPVATAPTQVPGLDALRRAATLRQARAAAALGRVLAAGGEHDEALALLLLVDDPDEATLVALLRSEAAVHGTPTALTRYARYRDEVRDRLGVDPGPQLQALHTTLLAADNPIRNGVRHDVTPLVGRDDDVRRLRALVRRSRVTSILGPGGLGKTRLAHLLAREADQPVVHVVELAGVASPDDVVGEVGSVLGVRDSVSGRRVLTVEQRHDLRGRLARQLDQVPTLLVIDNCEHVVGAVADLVATLVATTRELRVVTTTRAPLGIAAEQVFALGQLAEGDAVELFRQRAEAARPGVRLDPDVVRRVVARLDGLPLAVELAAAKVRAMSVTEVDRRLDDRFALLRGTDRGAPDRHRTLLAVIDWSWALLGETERRALRRLAVFHDGFALEGADAVLGHDALPALESLVGQSLVTVRDDGDTLRYRMLETVREFGRDRLVEAGEVDATRACLRAWATDLAGWALGGLYGPDQVSVVGALVAEDNNLADVLREALGRDDPGTAVVLLAALGACWTIRGEHVRVLSVLAAFEQVLAGWEPPDALADAAARAAGVLVLNTIYASVLRPVRARALLDRLGPRSTDPGTRAVCRLVGATDVDGEPDLAALTVLADDGDRPVAMLALQWLSLRLENDGDPEGSAAAAERALALWRPEDGVQLRALQHTQLAGLSSQLGRGDEARSHAEAGLAVLDALGADDDATQLRAVLVYAAVSDGRVEDAQQLLDVMEAQPGTGLWGGTIVLSSTRAEVELARGRVEVGLALYDSAAVHVQGLRFPGFSVDAGFEPWTLFAESAATTAHARHGRAPGGEHLHRALTAKVGRVLDPDRVRFDYPIVGCVLFGLGAWGLLRDRTVDDALTLLALAERFAYSRYAPSMAWDPMVADADAAAPGELGRRVAAYGGRRGADVLDDARAAVAHIFRE